MINGEFHQTITSIGKGFV